MFLDKQNREQAERQTHNAEPYLCRWQLLGFPNWQAYFLHLENEQKYYSHLTTVQSTALMSTWELFGFKSEREMHDARSIELNSLRKRVRNS